MGPRQLGRGNRCPRRVGRVGEPGLQWGHGNLAVETKGNFGTSIEKNGLQWGHGNLAVETWIAGHNKGFPFMLQWGHGNLAVETRRNWTEYSSVNKLQWGHGNLAVETVIQPGLTRHCPVRSPASGNAKASCETATAGRPSRVAELGTKPRKASVNCERHPGFRKGLTLSQTRGSFPFSLPSLQ